MNMRNRIAVRLVLVVVGFVALVLLARISPAVPKVKARAQHIANVNSVRTVSFAVTNSLALRGAQPSGPQ